MSLQRDGVMKLKETDQKFVIVPSKNVCYRIFLNFKEIKDSCDKKKKSYISGIDRVNKTDVNMLQ